MSKIKYKFIKDGDFGPEGVLPDHMYLDKRSEQEDFLQIHMARQDGGYESTPHPDETIPTADVWDYPFSTIYTTNVLSNQGRGKPETDRYKDDGGNWIGGEPTDTLGLRVYQKCTVSYPSVYDPRTTTVLDEPVSSLFDAMGRTEVVDRQTGLPFVIMNLHVDANAETYEFAGYQVANANATMIHGPTSYCSLWFRAITGRVVARYPYSILNGVDPSVELAVVPADGWVHLSSRRRNSFGYAYPDHLTAEPDTVYQVAIPYCTGSSADITMDMHTTPLT